VGHVRQRMTRLSKSATMAAASSFVPPAPMGILTTHVLDTMNGCAAAGMRVALYRLDGDTPRLLRELALDADGRAGGPLLEGEAFEVGRYRLLFEVGAYFRARGAVLRAPEFLDLVPVDFGVSDAASHYHVPLLAGPWSYSTYRGT